MARKLYSIVDGTHRPTAVAREATETQQRLLRRRSGQQVCRRAEEVEQRRGEQRQQQRRVLGCERGGGLGPADPDAVALRPLRLDARQESDEPLRQGEPAGRLRVVRRRHRPQAARRRADAGDRDAQESGSY